jgi:hypothetical protein
MPNVADAAATRKGTTVTSMSSMPRVVRAMRYVWAVLSLALVLTGCGGKSSGPTEPTLPAISATREITVLEDNNCRHLGDEMRLELCGPSISNSLTREWSWTFAVTSQPTEGHLTLGVVNLGRLEPRSR